MIPVRIPRLKMLVASLGRVRVFRQLHVDAGAPQRG